MESMEVDEARDGIPKPPPVNKNALFVCFLKKKGELKKSKMPVENFEGLSLESLKSAVTQELNRWEWTDEKDKPTNFDILHRSRTVITDEDVKRIGPLSVVTVITKSVSKVEDHKSAQFIEEYIKNRNTLSQLTSCSMAIRTAFLNSKFITMIENLGNSEMLENMFAMVPELRNDPIAIGIIQDPSLIYHLSDPESIKKLAKTRPWVIEAFNFISASIHQERGGPPQGIPNHLFNAAMFDDGDDEDMDDSDDDGDGSGPSGGDGGAGARITREQLSAALNALGGGAGAAAGLSRSNAFGGLFQSPQASSTTAQSSQPQRAPTTSNPGVAQAGANIQNLMDTLAGRGGGMPGQSLSSEMVARAVTEALRRLTPEQRADQLNAIRNFATQFGGGGGAGTGAPQSQPPQQPSQPPPSVAPSAPPPQSGGQSSSSLAQQFQSQLRQMREMGITDERLSILALRVSEGDLNTAVELIFSGWQGEGADMGN